VSSSYVRTLVRSWLVDSSIDTPYYDTINKDQNPTDDNWFTAEFDTSFWERTVFCPVGWTEEGEVSLMFNGLAGVGDGSLLAKAEKDIKTLLSFRDPQNRLVITGIAGVNEFSGGTANMGYQLEYILTYQFAEASS